MADDTDRVIAELTAVDDPHGLVSIASVAARASVVCRCGWSSRPTTRDRGLGIFLKHRQRIAIGRIAKLEPPPDAPDER